MRKRPDLLDGSRDVLIRKILVQDPPRPGRPESDSPALG